MIKILIIEDEIPARKKLKRHIEDQDASTEIVSEVDTVAAATLFLSSNKVDLIFSDIELLDGNAFEIFKQVHVSCPIIFTTAYDQFWANAFETNGIEYLLKPFSKERFSNAWQKFLLFRTSTSQDNSLLVNLTKLIEQNMLEKGYKKRFTAHANKGLFFLNTDEITYFEAKGGVVFVYDLSAKKYMLKDTSLKELELQLDPVEFFRLNRSELINKRSIEKILRFSKNIIAVKMKGSITYLKTSQSNTAEFRDWLNK